MNEDKNRLTRKSGIDLLKVIGIALIVLSHVIQNLTSKNIFMPHLDYYVNLNSFTGSGQRLLLSMLRYSGVVGNTIFFLSSAWFLVDKEKNSIKKVFRMMIDVWIISLIFLAITYFLRNGQIDKYLIIKQIFPISFSQNWYVTAYLIFYLIFPMFNMVIRKVNQKILLNISLLLAFIYIFLPFFIDFFYYGNDITLWIALYFVIAYMKLYMPKTIQNKKFALTLFFIGFCGNYGTIFIMNYLGYLKINKSFKLLKWNTNFNFFIIVMVIGLFFLMKDLEIHSKIIGYISSLSLYIYLIHENVLFFTYFRPYLIVFVYDYFGYKYILPWIILISIIVFLFGFMGSVIYTRVIKNTITKFSDFVFVFLSLIINKCSNFFMKFD